MAITVQNFIKLANYYNQTTMLMSAICVQKGGIAMENYVVAFTRPMFLNMLLNTAAVYYKAPRTYHLKLNHWLNALRPSLNVFVI